MRDFKAGGDINVAGDINIHDASSSPKLLVMCTNEELVDEMQHRKSLLEEERRGKLNRTLVMWGILAMSAIAGSVLSYLSGDEKLWQLILGVAAIGGGFVTTKLYEKPTEFEARQLQALQEIEYLLRERGHRH